MKGKNDQERHKTSITNPTGCCRPRWKAVQEVIERHRWNPDVQEVDH